MHIGAVRNLVEDYSTAQNAFAYLFEQLDLAAHEHVLLEDDLHDAQRRNNRLNAERDDLNDELDEARSMIISLSDNVFRSRRTEARLTDALAESRLRETSLSEELSETRLTVDDLTDVLRNARISQGRRPEQQHHDDVRGVRQQTDASVGARIRALGRRFDQLRRSQESPGPAQDTTGAEAGSSDEDYSDQGSVKYARR